MSKKKLSIFAVIFAAIILFSVNLASWDGLKLLRADMTANRLFTITDSTRKVIAAVDDPIVLKLYYTDALGAQAPAYGLYADRIQALLGYYASASKGKIKFVRVAPKPFSDEEDRAVAAGLTAVTLGGLGDKGYLGLVGSNSTDNEETISFMSLERSAFLEYDLTRMVHKLSNPARKTVGLITTLDMNGAMGPNGRPQPAWLVMQRIKEFFGLKMVDAGADKLPEGIDILLIVSPGKLSDKLTDAIDKFARAGKPVMAFADPFTETRQSNPTGFAKDGANYRKLLSSWGADIAADKVVGDVEHARSIQFRSTTQPVVARYLVWLSLQRDAFDVDDAVFANIERLLIATSGNISWNKKAGTKFQPLISLGKKTTLFSTEQMVPPDPLKLLNSFAPDGKGKVIAARLSGGVNVIVIADSDMLYNSFWAQARNVVGQQVIVPISNNPDLLLNALGNLSGGEALSGLRGRGVEHRPFTLIDNIQRNAEAKFRQREKALQDKLVQTQNKLNDIQGKVAKGQVILSDEDKQAFQNFRSEVVSIRQELRDVQRAMNEEIDRLEFWVQFINAAGVPLLIGLIGLLFGLSARRRRVK